MLALSNKHGEVMASIPGLADMARLTLEETEEALKVLESPDKYSRTPDHEGRRLFTIDGGWHVVNYRKHRRMASIDEQREMNAARQRRWYEKHKNPENLTPNLTVSNGSVTPPNEDLTHQTDNAEAEAEYRVTTPPIVPPPLSKTEERLCDLFKRRHSTPWSDKEKKAFKKLKISDAELSEIEVYYKRERAKPKSIARKDLATLLNNWRGELDRARQTQTASHRDCL